MIKIRIKNADHEIDVRFPISENELYAKLAEIHATCRLAMRHTSSTS